MVGRVTPEANAGTVDVSTSSNENDGAIINVTYQLTGLSSAGHADLERSFIMSAFADMMKE
jgi:hypothetical protein